MEIILLIGIGGFIGANARHWLSQWIAGHLGADFPWATLVINFTGSLLLAVFFTWGARHVNLAAPQMRYLVATGFFGAYTTYSTFANESIALFQRGDWNAGLSYIVITNVMCLGGVAVGVLIGSRL